MKDKAQVQYAVLSYCKDLTDPDAESMPVAVIGLGHIGGTAGFLFYVVRSRLGDRVTSDERSQTLLNDLPGFLHDQVLKGLRNVGLENFVDWLHDQLRNSVHISSFREQTLKLNKSASDPVVMEIRGLFDKSVEKPSRVRWLSKKPDPALAAGPVLYYEPLPEKPTVALPTH